MNTSPVSEKTDLTTLTSCLSYLRSSAIVDTNRLQQGTATVKILEGLGMDEKGQIAALLHCIDTDEWEVENRKQFDGFLDEMDPVAVSLYQGVRRLQQLSSFSRHGGEKIDPEANEDNLRKMLITMVDDVRIVLIKLADQLRCLKEVREREREDQLALSRITLDVFAPLANRLGIWQLKWEMEDFALRYQHPQAYRTLASQIDEKRAARERYIETLIDSLKAEMAAVGIEAQIYGRPKHLYSIWKKMNQKGLSFENLWDIRAVRIIVDSIAQCYSALGVVHTMWKHLPGEFDDYVATPKANGYRSIHTVVIGPQDKSVEVQIRTHAMHQDNELGVAAHWRYKENRRQDDSIDNKVLWLRQLLEWKEEVSDSEFLAEAFQNSVENQRVYVFTPKGTVVDLPEGATPIDFAYAIHSEVGHSTRGARVNGKMVSLNYRLNTGDQVQIQTIRSGTPSRDWLRPENEYVHTSRARQRIQQWFKHKDHDHHVADGRSLLERELDRLGLSDISYDRIASQSPFNKTEDFLAALGANDFKLSRALAPFRRELERKHDEIPESRVAKPKKQAEAFKVNGVGNLLTAMAKCCQPVPGDRIIGYITTGKGVTIHHQQCNNIQSLDEGLQNRLIDVEWGDQDSSSYPVEVKLSAYHRSGILHDVTQVLKDAKVDVLKVNMETDAENIAQVHLTLEVSGLKALSRTLGRLAKIQNVLNVRRLTK